MGTRAVICGRTAEGPRVNYVHIDGYPCGVGMTLMEHYSAPNAVDDLLRLGDLDKLGKTRSHCRLMPDDYGYRSRIFPVEARAGEGLEAALVRTLNDHEWGRQIEWAYVFDDGAWRCGRYCHGEPEWDGMTIPEGIREYERWLEQWREPAPQEEEDGGLPSPAPW